MTTRQAQNWMRQPNGQARLAALVALGAGLALALNGCATRMVVANLGSWTTDTAMLGPVAACQGGFCCHDDGRCEWPMSLTVPPPAETYQHALVQDAVKRYGVVASDVVLKDVSVELHTEVVGTVRGWAAKAIAGRKPGAPSGSNGDADAKPDSIEMRLRNLKALHDQGLITDDEMKRRKAAILEEL